MILSGIIPEIEATRERDGSEVDEWIGWADFRNHNCNDTLLWGGKRGFNIGVANGNGDRTMYATTDEHEWDNDVFSVSLKR